MLGWQSWSGEPSVCRVPHGSHPHVSRHLLQSVLGDADGPDLVLTALWSVCPLDAIVYLGNVITKQSLCAVSCPGCWRPAVNKTSLFWTSKAGRS